MIRCILISADDELILTGDVFRTQEAGIKWFFVDFDQPTATEKQMLMEAFDFHPLAIEDCFHYLQRPKLEYYTDHSFFVLHALDEGALTNREINLFASDGYLVSYHEQRSPEIDVMFEQFRQHVGKHETVDLVHKIIDKIVDGYFPIVHAIEDALFTLEERYRTRGNDRRLMEEIFELRARLLRISRTVMPMRDLLYRVVESKRLSIHPKKQAFFRDLYDHLLKLSEMIEYNRLMTSEFRDNFISLNSYRMNSIMKTLTIFTTIFMPLTFIAGIYGMNFEHMPELTTRYGYFVTLGAMALLALGMILFFKKNRWFDE